MTDNRKNVYGPFNYQIPSVSEEDVRVKLYAYNPDFKKATVVFKYSDLINRAIAYKNKVPTAPVEIIFSIYKITLPVYIGFMRNTASYGWVGGTESHGPFCEDPENSEKLVYSLIKAAKNGVCVKFLYHNPQYLLAAEDPVTQYLHAETVDQPWADNIKYHKIEWPLGNYKGQQHNKFLLASHIEADKDDKDASTKKIGNDDLNYYTDALYVSTANVDEFKTEASDWYKPDSARTQDAVMVYRHAPLYTAYRNYFRIMFANYDNQNKFWESVTDSHNEGTLNYVPDESIDPTFSAYFFPIPNRNLSDAWDTTFNPLAKYVEKMADSSKRYLKMNVYHFKSDEFGQRFMDMVAAEHQKGGLNVKSAIHKNSYLKEGNFPKYDGQKFDAKTHAKNYMFAFSDIEEYYCMIGSTNAKLDAFNSKANNILVIREVSSKDHPVYDVFKTPMFSDAFNC